MVETHLMREEVGRKAETFRMFWDITASPAQRSTESVRGCYGGCWLGVKKHMNSTRVKGDRRTSGVDFAHSSYVAARCIHLRGADVLLLAVYAKDGCSTFCVR